MVKLYISHKGIVHLVQGDYICNYTMGKISKLYPDGLYDGTRYEITCKNCKEKLN